ncbi:tRNA (adenine37-N(6))-methyltransferase TrmN6 (EC [Olavius sp. associated proteobacterium Delta 1]|nr:tRNA (adenine37-N(6))-methyltransferase TrmN6 (EC [Olavius sp. associated proteobacterium Delta 1]
MSSYTTDSFFDGKIRVMQNRRGYRFSIDAVLLAYHAAPRTRDKVLDLGTGCGIISLIMACRRSDLRIYAVEVQTELADLTAANVHQNQLQDRIDVLRMDMKILTPQMTSGPCDLIVSNPPYHRSGSGRINPDAQRAIARHEIKASLVDVLQTTRRMLRTAGRFVTIFTAERTADILSQMRNEQIEPKSLRMVHSNRVADARLILIEGVKGGRPGLKVAPPLIVYDDKGDYTAEVQQMFEHNTLND